MYFIIALSLAVLGFFFPPLWLVAVIFFAGAVLSSMNSTAKGIGDALEKSRKMKCRLCEKEIERSNKTCPHCGHVHL